MTAEQKEHLLHLGQRLEAAWNHPAASPELKKRILRTVLHEIVINNTEDGSAHVLVLHWQGGVHTELRVQRNRPGQHRRVTDGNVIELIRELSKVCTDSTIAATLNRLGYRTGTGKTWRAHSVQNVRYHHRLPNYTKGQDWLTVEQAAEGSGRERNRDPPLDQTAHLAGEPGGRISSVDHRTPGPGSAATCRPQSRPSTQGRQLPKTSPDQAEFPWK